MTYVKVQYDKMNHFHEQVVKSEYLYAASVKLTRPIVPTVCRLTPKQSNHADHMTVSALVSQHYPSSSFRELAPILIVNNPLCNRLTPLCQEQTIWEENGSPPKTLCLDEVRSSHRLSTGTSFARGPKIPKAKYNELTLGGKGYKATSPKVLDTPMART
jgi:hypothetical protein